LSRSSTPAANIRRSRRTCAYAHTHTHTYWAHVYIYTLIKSYIHSYIHTVHTHIGDMSLSHRHTHAHTPHHTCSSPPPSFHAILPLPRFFSMIVSTPPPTKSKAALSALPLPHANTHTDSNIHTRLDTGTTKAASTRLLPPS